MSCGILFPWFYLLFSTFLLLIRLIFFFFLFKLFFSVYWATNCCWYVHDSISFIMFKMLLIWNWNVGLTWNYSLCVGGPVYSPPVLKGPEVAYRNTRVEFTCEAQGFPPSATYQFMKVKHIPITNKKQLSVGHPPILYLKVINTSAGKYYCRVTVLGKSWNSNILNLEVISEYGWLIIIYSLHNVRRITFFLEDLSFNYYTHLPFFQFQSQVPASCLCPAPLQCLKDHYWLFTVRFSRALTSPSHGTTTVWRWKLPHTCMSFLDIHSSWTNWQSGMLEVTTVLPGMM